MCIGVNSYGHLRYWQGFFGTPTGTQVIIQMLSSIYIGSLIHPNHIKPKYKMSINKRNRNIPLPPFHCREGKRGIQTITGEKQSLKVSFRIVAKNKHVAMNWQRQYVMANLSVIQPSVIYGNRGENCRDESLSKGFLTDHPKQLSCLIAG